MYIVRLLVRMMGSRSVEMTADVDDVLWRLNFWAGLWIAAELVIDPADTGRWGQ